MADYAAEHYGLQGKQARIVYNGVGDEFFVGKSASSEGLVIGTVGRLQPQKNLGMFLEAARLVLEGDSGARFVIAGDGLLRAELENRASELGLGHAISFRGNIDDVPSMLGSLSQFWLSSDWEGTPNVVLEAMAAGLPVVATPAGGTPELLDEGQTGWFVDFGDASALAGRALQLGADAELATAVGAAAREEARRRFSIPVMVSETRKVYELAASGDVG
jgi:glycosyltransferase involved in cell wall biosynthesis